MPLPAIGVQPRMPFILAPSFPIFIAIQAIRDDLVDVGIISFDQRGIGVVQITAVIQHIAATVIHKRLGNRRGI